MQFLPSIGMMGINSGCGCYSGPRPYVGPSISNYDYPPPMMAPSHQVYGSQDLNFLQNVVALLSQMNTVLQMMMARQASQPPAAGFYWGGTEPAMQPPSLAHRFPGYPGDRGFPSIDGDRRLSPRFPTFPGERDGLPPIDGDRRLNHAQIPEKVRRWLPLIQASAEKYGVPPAMIAAVMTQESGGNPNAGSHAGAQGLMQFMPNTFRDVARRYGIQGDIRDPRANIEAGAAHLRELYDRYGNWKDVLVAYNAGPGKVGKSWNELKPETQAYVPSVMEKFRRFSNSDSALAQR